VTAARVCAYDRCRRPARLYAAGLRCAEHTPAREHGRPEPPETGPPWWVRPDGTVMPPAPISASWLYDQQAISSGKRVSGVRRILAAAGETYDRERAS
jgi:hypothetical protein